MARTFDNPRTQLKLLTRNFSQRSHPVHGKKIMALAVHSTESHPRPGSADLQAIYNWFSNPASQASSHYVIDDRGESWQLVREADKAWTIGAANSFTINYEMIGFARDSEASWLARLPQLKKLAQHLAHNSRRLDIPLRKGEVANKNGVCVCTRTGVIRHSDVTRAGFGSHTDPGAGFPLRRVILLAQWYKVRGWIKNSPPQ
jgi:hypothetical protein